MKHSADTIGNALADVIASHSGNRSDKEMRRLLAMEQSDLLEEFSRLFPEALDICRRLRTRDYKKSEIEMLIRAYHKNAQP